MRFLLLLNTHVQTDLFLKTTQLYKYYVSIIIQHEKVIIRMYFEFFSFTNIHINQICRKVYVWPSINFYPNWKLFIQKRGYWIEITNFWLYELEIKKKATTIFHNTQTRITKIIAKPQSKISFIKYHNLWRKSIFIERCWTKLKYHST